LNTVSVFAETPFELLENKYNVFTEKLETKYNNTKIIDILEKLSGNLDILILKKNISESKRDYIRFLYDLNRQQINFLKSADSKSGQDVQKSKEFKYTVILKAQSKRKTIPKEILTLISGGKKLYQTNSVYEFYDEESKEIKKIFFKNFYKISSDIIPLISSIDWIIVSPKEGEYIYIENYSFEKKHAFSVLYTDTDLQKRFIDLDKKYVLEENTYFTYLFNQYQVFADEYWFYDSTFTRNNINKENITFVRDSESRFWYVSDYKKVKLISKEWIIWVENVDRFLSTIADDKKYLTGDSDNDFENLKRTVKGIIKDTDTKSEKIQKIYAWILENISYSREFDIEDKQIFSWIDTFGDHEWVCDGYVKLMTYMLLYAGVDDVEIIRWDVIDAADFPYIWHAWLRIGEDYYDPTFDDPVGLTGTLTYEQYRFFKLPRDLLYTNRFDYADTPESLKKAPLIEREELIKRNLSNLVSKYEKNEYLLLKPFKFRKDYDINYNEKISVDVIKNILPYIEQISSTEIIKNWTKQKVRRLGYSYYTVDNTKDLEFILQTVNYNIDNLWLIKSISWEYRVGYDVIVQ
jgi:hypothetical protein